MDLVARRSGTMLQQKIDYNEEGIHKLINILNVNNYSFEKSISKMLEGKNKIFLRHDVDLSLEIANKMANIQLEAGIKGIFFIMINSPFYNIFEANKKNILREISGKGFEIGLHANIEKTGNRDFIEREVQLQKKILEWTVEKPISLVSFHQPTSIEKHYQLRDQTLFNTYKLKQLGIEYFSDSNRTLDLPGLLDAINLRKSIQLLLHPAWWLCDLEKPSDIWEKLIKCKMEEIRAILRSTERTYRDNFS